METFDKDIDLTIEIDALEKKFKRDKSVAIIGIGDSIGFSPNDYNYIDRIIRSIKFESNLEVFNGHFLTFDTESQIEDIILSDINMRDVKKINQLEIDMSICKKLEEKHLPIDRKVISFAKAIMGYKDRTFISNYEDLSFKDCLINNNTVHIFYSTNNNVFYKRVSEGFDENEKQRRRRNYDHILSMNPRATIYAIGLVAPNNFDNTLDNVKRHNETYQEIACEFGMMYIDPKGLNRHLKRDNNNIMLSSNGIRLLSSKCIEAMYENTDKTNFSTGLYINTDNNDNNSLEMLEERSIKRQILYDVMADNSRSLLDKSFYTARKNSEEEHIKILKKLKKGETYFE